MATRVAAATVLLVTALVAWATITIPLVARLLQVSVVASMLYVAYLAWRGSRAMRRALEAGLVAEEELAATPGPFVSLVVPARNEATVIAASMRALAAQRYAGPDGTPGHDLLVVDDASTDGTGEVARLVAADSPRVTVLRREATRGPRTKGAVLAHAEASLKGTVVGVIDADTLVEPAFLARVMRAWSRDPEAAAIQVSRRPRNAGRSWLTAAQAEEQLMDMASQCGRWATDGTAELRGNGMFVRRDALDAVGGWSETALTEDLELSTRLSAHGRHVSLAPEVAVDEEAVETIPALWRQRIRWAEGSLRRLLEHGPRFVLGPHPWGRKADFIAFTGEFLVPPLFAATIAASLVSIPLPQPADWSVPLALALSYGVGVFLMALAGLSASGQRGAALVGRAARGALFLSHWLIVVPVALLRIALLPEPVGFVQTPRFGRDEER